MGSFAKLGRPDGPSGSPPGRKQELFRNAGLPSFPCLCQLCQGYVRFELTLTIPPSLPAVRSISLVLSLRLGARDAGTESGGTVLGVVAFRDLSPWAQRRHFLKKIFESFPFYFSFARPRTFNTPDIPRVATGPKTLGCTHERFAPGWGMRAQAAILLL